MSRRKQSKNRNKSNRRQNTAEIKRRKNKVLFLELVNWFAKDGELFTMYCFHGNIKWDATQLVVLALIWSWQETTNVTDAFEHAFEQCQDLGLKKTAKSYTSMMNALESYQDIFVPELRQHFQQLVEEACGRFYETDGKVLIAFDGSRATAPRSVANEEELCAPNYGKGRHARRSKKKSEGLQRKRNEENPPHPPAPQAWITMMWHMGARLPWTWRLGPSNSSERDHVKEIVNDEEFPENVLFCGDAGFVGYDFWRQLVDRGHDFLVRVGANVSLLAEEYADIEQLDGGIVLCWPRNEQTTNPPLRLRLVRIKIGKTKMWMLTNVLQPKKLSKKQITRYYKLRWGIEVEFRGLKQVLDKHKLRCRNPHRLLVELDWSIRAMAVAELLSLHQQMMATKKNIKTNNEPEEQYSPKDRSLANTMRALRKCLRRLHESSTPDNDILYQLSKAVVQRYNNSTDKKPRYRPKNPDKKPLGNPKIRKLKQSEEKRLEKQQSAAA